MASLSIEVLVGSLSIVISVGFTLHCGLEVSIELEVEGSIELQVEASIASARWRMDRVVLPIIGLRQKIHTLSIEKQWP